MKTSTHIARMRLTLLIVTVLLGLGLWTLTVQIAYADDCAQTYTVKWGDWLANIAYRHGLSLGELVVLNHSRLGPNLNLIYPGQVLCLGPAPADGPRNSNVAIQLTFQYDPNDYEKRWEVARQGLLAKRVVYPLAHTSDTVETVGTPQEVSSWLTRTLAPVLLGVRNSSTSNDYTLVGIGDNVFNSWFISDVVKADKLFPPNPISNCPDPKPLTVLSGDVVARDAKGQVLLENEKGVAFPFNITLLDWKKDANAAQPCYGSETNKQVGFAIAPADSAGQHYKIRIVLKDDQLGPPGIRWRDQCSAWAGGWYYGWMRWFMGC
ncbi:MAG: LysM peptidoglycan-binding domain-containing protein [Acidobacteriota bacterium]